MRIIEKEHDGIGTLLAFILIPLSGLATDIYLPSLPAMAHHLQASNAEVQLTIVFFLISYGISQLFVGSLLDSFGRYRLTIAALLLFSIASFTIARSHSVYLIYLMRIVHGITVAIIVVGKRAYFVDIFSGEKLKHYTSLFSIVWSAAPIIAPFFGGYLQTSFGWESNFYLLGGFALIIVILELLFGGESLKVFQTFHFKSIIKIYGSMLKTSSFSLGLIVLGLANSVFMVYGMSGPFIIEHVFNQSAITTGYCALILGIALLLGGFLGKAMINRPFFKKMMIAIVTQLIITILMILSPGIYSDLYTLMAFAFVIHFIAGFVFNNYFSYCLSLFPKNAGIASGVTGGSIYAITSVLSYGIVYSIPSEGQVSLGISYLILVSLTFLTFFLIRKKVH
ncbi:MFS transporter [Pedobacter caeni]|uniref:Predicted arabinose efflux permease, MFS family n=1 Tax=Pedobacter caeni TaxID=288992 RepID=A0A1M4VZ79_9SPHI|nr:MFS transporter [Pedobacter caeni]SHE74205.1 Predicted arabinose efflux permease, MFS family [Pedobacter caeni]